MGRSHTAWVDRVICRGNAHYAVLLLGVLISTAGLGRGQDQPAKPHLEDVLDRAQAAQAADHYAEAAKAYAEATRLDSRTPELWANRGLMEHFAGDPSEALASFKHALALKPSLYTAILFTGIDYTALNKPALALPYLKRARELQPSNPDTSLALGKVFVAMHDPRQATSAYQDATIQNAKSSAAWYGLGTASLALIDQDGGRLAKRHGDTSWSHALYADEMLMQGRTSEAIDAYKLAVAGGSGTEHLTFAAVLMHMRESQASSAQPAILASSIDRLLSVLQTTPAQVVSACPVYVTASVTHPNRKNEPDKQQMACSYLQNDVVASADLAAKRLAITPDDPEALYWSVKANEQRAVEAFAQFEHLAPQAAATYDLVGDLYRRRLQPDGALEQYAKALAIDPHDAAALLGSAAAYLSTGNMEQSMAAATIALADSPHNARLNLLMAEALMNLHRYSEAHPYLEKCLASTKEANDSSAAELAPRAHALLGRVQAEAGNVPEAIVEMKLGLSSDQDGSLYFQLSRLYRGEGKLAEAQQAEATAKELLAQRRSRAVTALRSSADSSR